MVEKQPERALSIIKTLKQHEDAERIYSAVRNIRQKIMRDPAHENPAARAHLKVMAANPNLHPNDRTKLKVLLKEPAHKIHWLQKSHPFLDKTLNDQFAALRVFNDPFYEFDADRQTIRQATDDKIEHINQSHRHERRHRTYNYDDDAIDGMIRTAVEWIHRDDVRWETMVNSKMLLEALCLLTGRRKWELCSTLKIRSVLESDLQAEISGVCKKRNDVFYPDTWYRVPLLAPLRTIVRGLSNLRKVVHAPGQYAAHKKLFPQLWHTAYRDIFARRAFRDRAINKFLEGMDCSESYFKSQCLVIHIDTFANHYTTLNVVQTANHDTEESGEQQQQEQREPDPLANEVH